MAKARAALPMYDAPELREANNQFWHALATALRTYSIEDLTQDLPQDLTRAGELPSLWSNADLLFGQTCGYPLTHGLCGDAQILATPLYDVAECEGPYYGSASLSRVTVHCRL